MGLRIVFMGTPQFASYMLERLNASIHEVVGVVTVADKPAGRGQKVRESDVKKIAQSIPLPIWQPLSLKEEGFVRELEALKADLFVVVAFRMLPEVIWRIPKRGTINLHASLLPEFRGAAPINWAIIAGESETGLSTFYINDRIDEGPILLQKSLEISEKTTAGTLHDAMLPLGASLLLETLDGIEKQSLKENPQQPIEGKTFRLAPKLNKSNTRLDFNEDIQAIDRKVRGLSPYPGAYCEWMHVERQTASTFKVFSGKMIAEEPKDRRLRSDSDHILVPCRNGYYAISEIQAEGKKRMSAKAFLAGNRITDWELL